MRALIVLSILALPPAIIEAQTGNSDPGGVLRRLAIARFAGSGTESIQAMTSDIAGNVYVAGTTSSADFPVRNATQPAIGEAVLMRSSDRGLSWQKLPNPPAVPITITPHPGEPQTLFIGGRDGIYKTTDGGRTWRQVYSGITILSSASSGGTCCFSIAVDPLRSGIIYAYTWSPARFLASSDGGESWQVRNLPQIVAPGTRNLWVDPNGSGTVALGMWLSRDRGSTWARMESPPMWNNLSFTAPAPWHPGWIYVATSAGTGGRLYLSRDWGATWSERPSPMRGSNPVAILDLVFDPDITNRMYASDAFGFLQISDDGGASWHVAGIPGSLERERQALLSRRCGGGALLAVVGRRIIPSLDFGATWQPPPLSRVLDLAAGGGCAVYAVREFASDAFVAKLGPGGREVLWSTFLGGSDLDAASLIALDAKGNVYVAGNTASADFPMTASRSGAQGEQDVFAAKLDPDGRLIYSVVFGGDLPEGVTGLAVNAAEEAHLVGWTSSRTFPTTLGAFQTEWTQTSDGFAIKLGGNGTMVYASYLSDLARHSPEPLTINPPRALAVTIEAAGSALIGGYAGLLSRMSPDGSSLTALPRQPGQIFAMETDSEGNIYVAGQVKNAVRSGSCFQGFIFNNSTLLPGDIFLTKLRPDDLQPLSSTRLWGSCQSWPRFLSIGPGGELTLSLWTYGSFPMRNPVLPVPRGGFSGSAAIARLSADGAALLFSSYLNTAQPAPIAVAPDGSIYAGVPSAQPLGHADVLEIPVARTGGPIVEGVHESFGGGYGYAAQGTLLTITGQNLAPESIDLGLNNPNPLPLELGGVRVLFDGVPAEMFRVAPDQVISVVPAAVVGKDSVTVQVAVDSQVAVPFSLPVSGDAGFGLLTHHFPALPPGGSVDGNIRNADGTLNDAEHPAAPGSTVTLFAQGLGGRGSTIGLWWNAPPPQRFEMIRTLPATVHRVQGFIDPLFAVEFRIPDAPGPGVYLVPTPGVLTRAEIGRVGSGLGVYVK